MSEPNLKEIAHKLGQVAVDLAAVRGLVDPIIGESPDVQTASHLGVGIDSLLIRAGRAVEQVSTSLGQPQRFDWDDYAPLVEREEEGVKHE